MVSKTVSKDGINFLENLGDIENMQRTANAVQNRLKKLDAMPGGPPFGVMTCRRDFSHQVFLLPPRRQRILKRTVNGYKL